MLSGFLYRKNEVLVHSRLSRASIFKQKIKFRFGTETGCLFLVFLILEKVVFCLEYCNKGVFDSMITEKCLEVILTDSKNQLNKYL